MEVLNTIFSEATNKALVNVVYILASVLFIFGLKMLGSPETARKGNLVSAMGMLIAVVVTLLDQSIIDFKWIFVGLVLGSLVGVIAAMKVKMTAMPEMVAIFNGFGGIASLLVGSSEYLSVCSTQHRNTNTNISNSGYRRVDFYRQLNCLWQVVGNHRWQPGYL